MPTLTVDEVQSRLPRRTAGTSDHDFEQAGFAPLLK